jgi:hypothetical protein
MSLLYFDGEDLRSLPLIERKRKLGFLTLIPGCGLWLQAQCGLFYDHSSFRHKLPLMCTLTMLVKIVFPAQRISARILSSAATSTGLVKC